jgi:hypothetical protein
VAIDQPADQWRSHRAAERRGRADEARCAVPPAEIGDDVQRQRDAHRRHRQPGDEHQQHHRRNAGKSQDTAVRLHVPHSGTPVQLLFGGWCRQEVSNAYTLAGDRG